MPQDTITTETATTPPRNAGGVAGTVRDAGETVKAAADRAARTAGDAFESRPLAAVGGALALGAVAATLIPATGRERELVGPLADRLRDTIDEAVTAAKEAGTGELTAAGLTFAAASNGLGGIVGSLAKAALVAGGAAATSVKQPRKAATPVEAPTPANQLASDDLAPVATA